MGYLTSGWVLGLLKSLHLLVNCLSVFVSGGGQRLEGSELFSVSKFLQCLIFIEYPIFISGPLHHCLAHFIT